MKVLVTPEVGTVNRDTERVLVRREFIGKKRWCSCGALIEIDDPADVLALVENEVGIVLWGEIECPHCHRRMRVGLL
jgi:hypothetical protein